MIDLDNYPSNHDDNALYRAELMQMCDEKRNTGQYTDEALKMQREVVIRAESDRFFFFNVLLWTYDPRPNHYPADKPFCTFPRQDDYLRWLEMMYRKPMNESGFADKSRDVGCSYVSIGWGVHHWLFDESFNMHLGSRKEDLVDKRGDPDCLFFKVEYMLKGLPTWMRPEGFNLDKHRSHMIIKRPDRSSTITGESANHDFGRGGRYSFTFLDEFGFWQWARSAWESCGESSHFRLAVTTPPPSGKTSHAYKLRTGQTGKVHVFTFDYNSVPWKSAEWILHAKSTKSKEEFNREVMRSYDSSSEGKVYAKEWQTIIKRDQFLKYNPALPLFLSWDFGLDGVGMIWWQKDFTKNWNYAIEAYMHDNKPIDFYIPFVTGTIGSSNFEYQPYELEMINRHREWKKPDGHFGDPDVKKRNMETGRSLKDYLAQAPRNIYVQTHEWSDLGKNAHFQIRELTKVMFERTTINPVTCESLEDAMINARYPETREESESTSRTKLPVHDYTSHLRTAFEYYMLNEPESEPAYEIGSHPAGTEVVFEEQSPTDDLSFGSLG